MKNTINKHARKENCLKTGLLGKFCYIFVMVSAFLAPLSYIQTACADRPDAAKGAAELSLEVSPSQVAPAGQITITSHVKAIQPIKVGMLLYRLVGPGGDINYLEPVIIRDFNKGDSKDTDTDYQVGNGTGNWTVEGYLCIGKCEFKGKNPPRNTAVSTTGGFEVKENTGGTIPLEQPSGLIQFPQ